MSDFKLTLQNGLTLKNLSPPKLKAALAADKGKPNVYKGKENTLYFVLTNNTGAGITIPANTDPPSNGFLLTISELFADKKDKPPVTFASNQDWDFTWSSTFKAFGVSAKNKVTVGAGDILVFEIAALEATVPLSTYQVSMTAFVTGRPKYHQVNAYVCNPSTPTKSDDFDQVFNARIAQNLNQIFTTNPLGPTLYNEVTLEFYNPRPGNPAVIPDNTPPDPNGLPEFIVTFDSAPESTPNKAALGTPEDIGNIGLVNESTDQWNTPNSGSPTKWNLAPVPTNKEILGPKVGQVAQFAFNNISTQFEPGLTNMYIQYINVPGYNDGFLSVELNKQDITPILNSFEISTPKLGFTSVKLTPGKSFDFNPKFSVAWDVTCPQNASPEISFDFQSLSVPNNNKDNITLNSKFTYQEKGWPFSLNDLWNADYTNEIAIEATINVIVTTDQSFIIQWPGEEKPSKTTKSIIMSESNTVYIDNVPPGTIVMWSGQANTIPTGWALCDGTPVDGYTPPDLTGRFIMGANAQTLGKSGEPDRWTPSVKEMNLKTGSDEGSHWHNARAWFSAGFSSGEGTYSGFQLNNGVRQLTADDGAHVHSVSGTITMNESPEGLNYLNRPYWYGLYYIIKLPKS